MRGRTFVGMVTAIVGTMLLAAAPRAAGAQTAQLPIGWHGLNGDYLIGTDIAQRPGGAGTHAATIVSKTTTPQSAGLLFQSIKADEFKGVRVALAAYVKTEHGDAGSAHLWLRVDGADKTLSSDYMLGRPILPGKDWALYSIVIDVPADAVGITFGVAQNGPGQLWVDDFTFDVTTENVTPSGQLGGLYGHAAPPNGALGAPFTKAYAQAPRRPVNLDFEQIAIAAR
jgi:hypothetical protein